MNHRSRQPSDAHPPPVPGSAHTGAPAKPDRPTRPPHHPKDWGPPWIGPIHHRLQIDLLWLAVTVLLMGVAMIFFGWRGLLSLATVGLVTLATYASIAWAMTRVRPNMPLDAYLHVLVMGLLMGLALPAMGGPALPMVAGLILGGVIHIIGRTHRVRTHPIAAVWVLLWLLTWVGVGHQAHENWLQPWNAKSAVLRPQRMVLGDLADAKPDNPSQWATTQRADSDALIRTEPYRLLISQQKQLLGHDDALATLLSSAQLVPMSQLILGATPGPMASSRVLLIMVGLYLIYSRLSWWPMAVVALGAAIVALFMMPLIHDNQPSIVLLRLIHLGPAVAISYVGLMVLASPFVWVVMILAPQSAPTTAKGRLVYAAILGCVTVITQWSFATPIAPYVGLLVASTLSPVLDALHPSPFAAPTAA